MALHVGLFADAHTGEPVGDSIRAWMQIAVHELSVCQALLIQVAEHACKQGAAAVVRITIECGPLSGVEPTLLKDAFAIMRLGGIAAAAELCVVPTVVRIECIECGGRTETRPNRLVCAACGGFRTRVIAGGELRLRSMEMRTLEPRPNEGRTRMVSG